MRRATKGVAKFLYAVMLVACVVGSMNAWIDARVFAQAPVTKTTETNSPAVVAPAKADAPVLSEMDALKIENAFLKIDAAQKNLDALKSAFQALLTSLQKPGFVIAQGQDGKLAYQPEPKPTPTPEVKK